MTGAASFVEVPTGPGAVGSRVRAVAPAAVAGIVVLLAWEFGLAALGVQQFLLPRPSSIAAALVDQRDILLRGIIYTGFEALVGLLVGVTLGVLAAFATARWATAREALIPIAIGMSAVPIIALAPISTAWFGVEGPTARIFIVAVMVFFPVMVNTVRGLTTVDPAAIELMRSYAAPDSAVLRKVRIPNALPYLFTALRVAATLAVIGAVIGEYFGGPRYSLGIYISSEAYLFSYANAWAGIVCACVIGITFFVAVLVLERLAIPWHHAAGRDR